MLLALGLVACLIPHTSCLATTNTSLSATVYPGYQFGAGEAPTIGKLNALGLPSVKITGTVAGSTLAAGGVDNVNLSTNAFDQITIIGGNGSGRTNAAVHYDNATLGVVSNFLAVLPLGITAAQIASNTITAAQIASNTITASQIASNTITAAQIAPGTLSNLAATAQIVLTNIGVPTNGFTVTLAHGWATPPHQVRLVAVCTNSACPGAYGVGNELASMDFADNASPYATPYWNLWTDATNIYVQRSASFLANWRSVATAAFVVGNPATNFTLTVYASQ